MSDSKDKDNKRPVGMNDWSLAPDGVPPNPLEFPHDENFVPPITDPKEADLYRQELLAFCNYYPQVMLDVSKAGDPDAFRKFKEGRPEMGRIDGIRIYLQRATVVLWDINLWITGSRGSEAFADQPIEPNLVNPPVQLWVPDRGTYLTQEVAELLGTQGRTELWAVLVIEDQIAQQHGIFVTVPFFIHRMDDPVNRVKAAADPYFKVPYFRLMTVPLGQPCEFRWQLDYLALLNFMKLSVTEVVPYKAPRPERRRAMKAGKELPDIRVVRLRKVFRAAAVSESGETKATREYSCHFLVGSHWRSQWYPSEQAHHPKFIAPYIKGDMDKPFQAPTKTIYNVVR